MKKRLTYIIGVFLLLLSPVLSQAQISYQYWIDDNKEAAVSGTTTDGEALSLSIDAAGLTTGVHFLNMRAGENKKWGTLHRQLFAIPRDAQAASTDLKGYEYWIDNDYANRVSANASGSSRTATFSVNASSLSTGIHFFNLRVQDANGQWGSVKRQIFCIPREQQADADKLITGYRYGFGDALTMVTLDTPVSEYTLTKLLDVPDPPLPIIIDDDCHFSFDEGEATLQRNVEMSFILTFTDQSNAMSSPAGTTFTVTDIQTTDILKFNVPGSQTIPAHASGGYTVTQFDIASAGTYILKSTETCSLRLYSKEEGFINGITSEGLTAGYPKELAVGTYYAVAFGNATETSLSVNPDDPSLITVATPAFSYEGDVITITTTTPNATIYYTLDGTDPTEESLVYSEPFTVTDNCTITAIAKRDGYYDSEISSLMVDWIVVGTPCGYAIYDSETSTLTFKYGIMPEGNNVWETDNTGTTIPSWSKSQIQSVVFESSYAQARPKSTNRWFCGLSKLTKITGLEYLNTSQVTDMSLMFYDCSGLTSLNVSGFNTTKVTDMSDMFFNCSGLTSLNVSSFNTENVTNMSSLFAGCNGLTSLNVSDFNTSKVTNMRLMFYDCRKLTSLNVSNFNTVNVTSMSSLFWGCSGLTSLNLSNFNTANVTNMSYMFYGCSGLTNLNVSGFDTSNVTNMSHMFYNCSGLTNLNVSYFDTENVTDMSSLFSECSGLTSLNVSNFDTSNATSMSSLFSGCSSLTSLNLSNFNTSNVTKMSYMFFKCSKLTSLNLSNFNTENVTNMNYMFYDCSSLTSLNVSNFNTSNVTSMSSLFSGCSSLTNLNVSNFDTSKVPDMSSMFYNCSSLTSLNVSNFNTSNVTKMRFMFSHCKKLTSLDVCHFNTSKVTDMFCMFQLCESLTCLDVSNFDTSNVTDMEHMFNQCKGLKSLNVKNMDTGKVIYMSGMFSDCESLTSLDLSSFNTHNVKFIGRYINEGRLSNNIGEYVGSGMFSNCSSLKTIYAGKGWSMESVTSDMELFAGCTNLVGGKGTTYNSSHIDKAYARIDGGPSAPGYFTEKSYILGDADGDGTVDVNDVTTTINHILGKPVANFVREAANIDGDESIDVNDVQGIIDIALGKRK